MVRKEDNILRMLKEQAAESARKLRRAVIVQPGAIGDCILTLPLAKFMKESLGLGGLDILGHSEYTGILPERTCVDGIRSIDSVDLHRLFVESKTFELADGDALISAFADYEWIVTFLGEPDSDFEQNLIFTGYCSHSVEVITLSLKAPEQFTGHIADFYIQQFISKSGLTFEPKSNSEVECLITATKADIDSGKEQLNESGIEYFERLVVIHPGSGSEEKCWHIDNFLAIAKTLGSKGMEVVFLLGPAELERFEDGTIESINSVGRCLSGLPLPDVLGVLSCSDWFIGNDSGITHLAAGLEVRTIAVFGPTNPQVYGPIGPLVTVLSDNTAKFAKKPSKNLQRELVEVLMTVD